MTKANRRRKSGRKKPIKLIVKKTLLEELKVECKSTTVTVKTLNGDCKHSSLAVDDLEVANIEEKQVDWMTLPRMFYQDDFPIASDEVSHLETFSNGIIYLE